MPRLALTALVLVGLSAVAVEVGEVLDLTAFGYLGALVAVMVLTSLTDRQRFWGAG